MYDVVIAGAGPVGLFLACELGLAGCSVLVLEREELGSPWRAAPLGRRGLLPASLEAFYRRGMLTEVLDAAGASGPDHPRPLRGGGHFAGMMVDAAKVDATALPVRLPSPAPDAVMMSLEELEAVLAEWAAKVGVEVRRGVAVTGVEQAEEFVVVRAGEQEYAGRWLVGCDGGRSTVRRLEGFDFVGTEPQFTGYTMLAEGPDLDKLRPGFNLTATGMYLQMANVPGHLGMMDLDGGAFDRSEEPTREHLQSVLRRVSGTDVTLAKIQLVSTFTDRAMQASTYRQGRVLLAGDAAHIHSPLGGQGLNLGLADAVNLGWKLAATVQGHAPEGLLDTYTSERHPIAARVLEWTRAQTAVMRPDPQAQALQGIVRDLLGTRDGATYVHQRIYGSAISYDVGSEHPLVGRNAPNFQLEDGTQLGDLMQDGRGVALDFSHDRSLEGLATDRVHSVAGPARDDLGLSAILIRPDGVVVWAGDREVDRAGFDQAVLRWFGGAAQ